jgi:TetR/AcrR family transcriptional regulator, transcriptional repressor of aconitase
MPRVSPDHLDARRRQILDAARRCFVNNGFHATSMQDVLAAAGLSAGAVYRYFPGKEDIILAIADTALDEITRVATDALAADPLPSLEDVVGQILAAIERLDAAQDVTNIAVQAWAEALRSPALTGQVAATVGVVRAALADLVTAYADRGLLPEEADPATVAIALSGLMPGYIVQRAVLGDVDARAYLDGLRALLAPQFRRPPAQAQPVSA